MTTNRQKPKQRDNYIDKTKFQHSIRTEWEPKKKQKMEFNKAEQREHMIQNIKQNSNNKSFQQLQLQGMDHWLELDEKVICKCNRRIKYYCIKCLCVNPNLIFPKVEIDVQVVILHHPEEKQSKSTGLPLQLLSPQIKCVEFKSEMQQFPEEGTYILYPHKQSILVSELEQKPKCIVAIDCTWYQTNAILRTFENKKVRYIRLEGYETKFWRYQHHGQKALATAQAVYFCLKEYYSQYLKKDNNGLDNLLFLYVLNHTIIDKYYRTKQKSKKQDNKKNDIKPKD